MWNERDQAAECSPTAARVEADAAYWTEQWLRYGDDGLDPLGERPDDYRARDPAEIAMIRAPHLPPCGRLRTEIQARRASAAARLSELDEHLRETFEQRRRLVDRIERCSVALRGLGHQFDHRRGRYRGFPRLAWLEDATDRIDAASPQTEVSHSASADPAPNCLSGAALRHKAEEILRVVEVSVTPAELIELLALDGVVVAGRPSQTLTNALRVSLARGDVARTGRGRYRWVPSGLAA